MSCGWVARYVRRESGWQPDSVGGQGAVVWAEAAARGVDATSPEEYRETVEELYYGLERDTARRRLDACRELLDTEFGPDLVARVYDHPHLLPFAVSGVE